jgi:probable HAF family extracellular repeat protein
MAASLLRRPWITLAALPLLLAGCNDSPNPMELADLPHPAFNRGRAPSSGEVVTLGVIGTASSINNRGQIVVLDASGPLHRSFIWDRGALTDLGTIGQGNVSASDLNSRGQIVGTAGDEQGRVHVFLWEKGRMRDLGAPPWSLHGYGQAINDAGRIVGYANPGPSFLWRGGRWTPLPPAPGDAVFIPMSISNPGVVVGYSQDQGNRVQPAIWKTGVTSALPTLGGTTGIAMGVNSTEQVVGYSLDSAGSVRATLWQGGTVIDLGTLGGNWAIANAVDNQGRIVGVSQTASGAQHAFLWHDGVMFDLGPGAATAINERGDVVGSYGGQAALWPKR